VRNLQSHCAHRRRDFDYARDWFQDVRRLYQRAAVEGRYVLFTADQ